MRARQRARAIPRSTVETLLAVPIWLFLGWIVQVSLQLLGVQNQVLGFSIVIGGTGLVALALVIRARRSRLANHAWALVNTRAGAWQFRSDRLGQPIRAVVKAGEMPKTLDSAGSSFAMSPDGSLLATVVRGAVSISIVTPSGAVCHWGDFAIARPAVQVRAVARKGDLEVWCAVVDEDRTQVARLHRPTNSLGQPAWLEVGDLKAAEYAAFWGSTLLLVAGGSGNNAHEHSRCWQVSLTAEAFRVQRPRGDSDSRIIHATDQAPRGLESQWITALDSANVGGRNYLALLARVEDEASKTDLVVLRANSTECRVERVDSAYEHVSVLRDPTGDPESVRVFAAKRGDKSAASYQLFLRPEAGTEKVANKRWPPAWPRRFRPRAPTSRQRGPGAPA